MPKRSSTPKDVNQAARRIVDIVTGESILEEDTRNQAAVSLGRLGGLKGGKARAASMSPAKRRAIAKKAAAARWKKD
jgi:hypothetical protein